MRARYPEKSRDKFYYSRGMQWEKSGKSRDSFYYLGKSRDSLFYLGRMQRAVRRSGWSAQRTQPGPQRLNHRAEGPEIKNCPALPPLRHCSRHGRLKSIPSWTGSSSRSMKSGISSISTCPSKNRTGTRSWFAYAARSYPAIIRSGYMIRDMAP